MHSKPLLEEEILYQSKKQNKLRIVEVGIEIYVSSKKAMDN